MNNERKKKLAAERTKRYRAKKKQTQHHEVRGLLLSQTVKQKLDEVRIVYAYPAQPYDETEAIENAFFALTKICPRFRSS
ncbi:hypothetical protein BOO36_17015 [Vibrio navarrensis]|uniref:hypothetical protein n=1 Tax=Vibrio navarrensis TaxID=29495 RepID=UPI001869F50E|nr:hypothetical protein [Vibrio navarrensis]MBE4575505.1 hypothetical protein [Vibrio navarrensis]